MSGVASKAFHSVAKEARLHRQPQTARPKGADPAHQEMARLHECGGNNAVGALLGGGVPLDPSVRAEMEARFGESFANVRVHDDNRAHVSAAAMHANAYTFGSDVVFGVNRFAPDSPSGKRLLAHEIAHVVQQRRGGGAPQLSSNAAHEHGADAAASAFADGQGAVAVQGATAVGVARDESEKKAPTDSLGETGDAVVDAVAAVVAGDSRFEQRVVAAAMRGFIAEMRTQLVDQDKALRFQERVLELLSPGAMAAYAASYLAGLAAGFVSPVTDLFGLPAFADAVDDFVKEAAASIVEHAPELITEGDAIAARFGKLQDEMVAALVQIMREQARDPRYLFKMAETAGDAAVQMAGSLGHGAAAEVIHLHEAPWEEEKDQDPGWKSVLPKDLAAAVNNPAWAALATGSRALEYGTERAKKKIFSTGWSKIGYAIGKVVGAVIANVLLLVFTAGIGNAIAAVGAAIGKLGPALRGFGTVVTKIAEALKVVGGAIKAVEEAVAVVTKTVLKPLERVLKPFGELLETLQKWLKKLFGAAKKEGAEVAAIGGGKLAAKLGEEAPKPTPHLDVPATEPHVKSKKVPKTKAQPEKAPKAKPEPKGAKTDVPPKTKIQPEPQAKTKAKPAAKKPPTKKPPTKKPPTKAERDVGDPTLDATIHDFERSKKLTKPTPAVSPSDDPLVVAKIEGGNKGQYWKQGTRRFERNAGSAQAPPNQQYVVLPKSSADDLRFRPAGTPPKTTIEPRVVNGKQAESLGAGRTTAGPDPSPSGKQPKPAHPITARTTRDPPTSGAKKSTSLEAEEVDPAAAHAFPRTIGADVKQAAGHNALLDAGEKGILRPGNISTGGVDSITAQVEGGEAKIFLNDFTTPGTRKVEKEAWANWKKELEVAIEGDRLNFGDRKIEDAIRKAFEEGRVYVRTVTVELPETVALPKGFIGPRPRATTAKPKITIGPLEQI